MTEAARCEVCGWARGYGKGLCYAHVPDYYDYEISACFRRGYERLKAENASLAKDLADSRQGRKQAEAAHESARSAGDKLLSELLETRRANASLLDWKAKAMLRLIELEPVHDELAAAEQRNTALEGALRWIAEPRPTVDMADPDADRARDALHALVMLQNKARAALHDEGRSEGQAPSKFCCDVFAVYGKIHREGCPSAAQGEEK